MAVDFTTMVYNPAFAVFARPVTFTPVASVPGGPAFTGRGIYSTQPIEVATEIGSSFSDQVTILDIIDREFAVVPLQGDTLYIPALLSMPALGGFEVIDTVMNGGGETTLTLRKLVTSKP
jgi:hypothetical protein